jgi:hypothetical protein
MADVSLLFRQGSTKIGAITLDVLLTENPTHSAEVTDHQVEEGANVSDHVRQKPDTLQLEGILSNTPVTGSQMTRVIESGGLVFDSNIFADEESPRGSAGYAEAAYKALLELKEAGTVITVTTSRKTYENMVIEQIQAPRDARTGDAIRILVNLKQVRIVSNRLTTVDTRDPRAKGKKSVGRQGAKESSTATKERRQSTLNRIGEGTGLNKWIGI